MVWGSCSPAGVPSGTRPPDEQTGASGAETSVAQLQAARGGSGLATTRINNSMVIYPGAQPAENGNKSCERAGFRRLQSSSRRGSLRLSFVPLQPAPFVPDGGKAVQPVVNRGIIIASTIAFRSALPHLKRGFAWTPKDSHPQAEPATELQIEPVTEPEALSANRTAATVKPPCPFANFI